MPCHVLSTSIVTNGPNPSSSSSPYPKRRYLGTSSGSASRRSRSRFGSLWKKAIMPMRIDPTRTAVISFRDYGNDRSRPAPDRESDQPYQDSEPYDAISLD